MNNLKKIIGTGIVLLGLLGGDFDKGFNTKTEFQKKYINETGVTNVKKAVYVGSIIGISLLATLKIDKFLNNKYEN